MLGISSAMAQVTRTPSFSAPYRSFAQREFGLALSFPSGADAAFEGLYRLGVESFDVALRGGFLFASGPGNQEIILVGAEFRRRVVTHSDDFPADGSVVFGIGALLGDFSQVVLPVGLSLGRRLNVEDSDVSITPYLQPTLTILSGDEPDGVEFGLGLGADFRLTRRFDLRVGVGLGDPEGISVSAVWVR